VLNREIDKISLLKEEGLTIFYTAMRINVLIVRATTTNAECKVVFVEVIEISTDEKPKLLAYHNGRYRRLMCYL
jgi:uncharacterized SAM-dependent methyltransferase